MLPTEDTYFIYITMKNNIKIIGALLLTLAVSACHKDADTLVNYAYADNLAFSGPSKAMPASSVYSGTP